MPEGNRRITLVVSAVYPYPALPPLPSLSESIQSHAAAYGFTDIVIGDRDVEAKASAVQDLGISVRAFNCVSNYLSAPCGRYDDPSAILEISYPAKLRNFGPVSYADIVTALVRDAGISVDRLTKSPYWRTAPAAWTNRASRALEKLSQP